MSAPISINDFSPHLFWDVDRSKLDFDKSKEQIVYQVVEYGMMKDWLLIQQLYSKNTLKEIVLNLRSLDKVTLSFLAHFFKVDKTHFRCYKQSQSNQSFWNS
jgi:ribosomal protein S8